MLPERKQSMSRSNPRNNSDRSQRGRLGAYALHATHDPRETTRKAREAFLAKFVNEVDPDRVLDPEERERRVFYARKAYFTRLALKSAQARRRGRGKGGAR